MWEHERKVHATEREIDKIINNQKFRNDHKLYHYSPHKVGLLIKEREPRRNKYFKEVDNFDANACARMMLLGVLDNFARQDGRSGVLRASDKTIALARMLGVPVPPIVEPASIGAPQPPARPSPEPTATAFAKVSPPLPAPRLTHGAGASSDARHSASASAIDRESYV
jgi:hypothetical protein